MQVAIKWTGCLLLATAVLALALGGPQPTARAQEISPLGTPPQLRGAPSPTYYNIYVQFADGNYRNALADYLSESRRSMKFGLTRWVDAICYHTMAGECYYQLGQLDQAMENYVAALQLYVANSDWMVPVQFDQGINPATGTPVKAVPWGQSRRAFRIGFFKTENLIQYGQINNNNAVRFGGVVQQPVLFPINVQEIIRCTSLAIKRRHELLGPLGPHDPLNSSLVEAMARQRSQIGHWSEAWMDVQLGMAYSATGKDAQAKTVLERSLVARGEFDHPLTAMAMVELGRLALKAGDYAAAARLLEETTYTAVNFSDTTSLEEAFELGYRVHIMTNTPGMYPPLASAVEWSRRQNNTHLRSALLTLAADNACMMNEPAAAAKFLADARTAMGRRDIANSRWGARLNYVQATLFHQQGNTSGGDTALNAALTFQRTGAPKIYQISLADQLYANSATPLSPRVAAEVYEQLLSDPRPVEWVADPLSTLAALVVPHHASFENWFDAAISRREYERALEIADLARRHRFHSSIDYGGRLLSLRWLLESPSEVLSDAARLQRQDILTRYPRYKTISDQAKQLRQQLAQEPLTYNESAAAKQQETRFAELAQVVNQQEAILREISLRREPCELVFPPVRTLNQVRAGLGERQGVLAFFATRRGMHGFLLSGDKFGYWPVDIANSQKSLVAMLREIGNWDQNKLLRTTELATNWENSAGKLYDLLTKDSKADLTYLFDELVIVPDGNLWYLPFEALQAEVNNERKTLLGVMRLRYAPTVGLTVADSRPRIPPVNTVIVLKKLYPSDNDEVAQAAFDEYRQAVPNAVALKAPWGIPTGIYNSVLDQLAVFAEVLPSTNEPLAITPMPLDERSPGSRLTAWLGLPWHGPDQILLPGFRSPAEDGLKNPAAGHDIFMTTCGLMGSGTRTILISRWRPGGQRSIELMREFAQELPHTTAADAWQRSVMLCRDREINPTLEPRIVTPTGNDTSEMISGAHPFFWAAYMLVDTGARPPHEPADASAIIGQPPQPAAAP